jgi:hypothetical protein
MAEVYTPRMWLPVPPINFAGALSLNSMTALTATGHKIAFVGRMWNKDGTSRNIRKIWFRTGSLTVAGGSGLTISMQDVSTSSGPPGQPDGTPDQTVAWAMTGKSSNTWYQSNALSADRTVAFGELVSVVFEYDGSGRLGADSFTIGVVSGSSSTTQDGSGGPVYYNGSAWATVAGCVMNSIMLEDDAGGFSCLEPGIFASAVGAYAYALDNATQDEVALKFVAPFTGKIDGVCVLCAMASGGDFDIVIEDSGGSVLRTVAVDGNTMVFNNLSGERPFTVPFPPVSISSGQTYYVSFKAKTNAVNMEVHYLDVSAAGHMDALPGGQSFHTATRVNGGAWTAVTTRKLLASIRMHTIDITPSGSGGVIGG